MRYDSHKPRRRSLRLKDYDYAQPGAYFVTTVTRDRLSLFGEIVADSMRLNAFGDIVRACWDDLPSHYAHIELDAFVVMPNHVHGIIILENPAGEGLKPSPAGTIATTTKRHGLPEIVRAFKTFSARRINELRGTPNVPVWQRSFHERVIRSDHELNRIRQYLIDNPEQWALDSERGRR